MHYRPYHSLGRYIRDTRKLPEGVRAHHWFFGPHTRYSLEAAHAGAVAGGVAGAVADAGTVTGAVTGIVDAGAVASIVDAGAVASIMDAVGDVTGYR